MDDFWLFAGIALLVVAMVGPASCLKDSSETIARAKFITECTTYITEKKARDMPELCEKLLMEKKDK